MGISDSFGIPVVLCRFMNRGKQNSEVGVLLHSIVLDKRQSGKNLSKDELWYYLTRILKVSQDEAEKMMERVRAEAQANNNAGPAEKR